MGNIRFASITILMASIFFCTSCVFQNYTMEDLAKARLDEIAEALENKDTETLKSIFSEKALSEAENLDEGIDYVFEIFQGDITEIEDIGSPTQYKSWNEGEHTDIIYVGRYIETTQETYMIYFIEYLADTENSENVGVQVLCVFREDDEEIQQQGWGGDYEFLFGIYIPEEYFN